MTIARAALLAVLAVACDVGGGGDRTDMMGDPVDPEEGQTGIDGGAGPWDAGVPWDGPKPMPGPEEPPGQGGDQPPIDASPNPPGEPPPEPAPDAHPPTSGTTWSDVDKCNQMCGAYCMKRYLCDGTAESTCRAAIDADNGGPCESRGDTFAQFSQERVESCIDSIQAMSCSAFLDMFNTGSGVPSACQGILN